MITHSVMETRQQKEQWGWGLVATGEGGCTKFEKKRGGVGNIGGVFIK